MIGDGLAARARSLWRGLRSRSALRAEMEEEFRLHQALRAEDLVRGGLSPAEAARQARLEFGSTEQFKDQGRVSRGLRPFDTLGVSWLDFKLGFRMLVKYPGLTLVGGLAMAFAIWMGAATFELGTQLIRPAIPLPEGDRLVGLQLWDAKASGQERQALHDFVGWRGELRTVTELGAARTLQRNLVTGEGRGEPITVAEISGSAFRLTRVQPLLGRGLSESDEQPDAPAVAVLGHDVWESRFGGDSGVVGQTVQLGATKTTIVGVMPEGYEFPVNHGLWTPLRPRELNQQPRQGPSILMFGRLAPGASLEEAQAELTTLGRRAAADLPDTHEHLRPQVMPYAKSIFDISGWQSVGVLSLNLPLLMLLTLICANVALLMFARAATREREIVVRTALGASRGRIVMQLFAEALVLGGIAAVLGLVTAGFGLRWVRGIVEGEVLEGNPLPFWFTDQLSPTTVLYAVLLAVLAAVIAGVMPALKVTRGLQARLQEASAGGGVRLGGVWTAVIIAQVAVTVAFPIVGYDSYRSAARLRAVDVGFPETEYLTARLEMDREPPPGAPADTSLAAFQARYAATVGDVQRRLLAEPGVVGVTYADRLPRMYHPHRLIEVDAGGAAPLDPRSPDGYRVSSANVAPDYFSVLRTPILQGRGFQSGDIVPRDAGGGVIVNQSFVELVLGGRSPLGRQIRYLHQEEWGAPSPEKARRGPWYQIVGVVPDLAMASTEDPKRAGFYHAASPSDAYPVQLAVHVQGAGVAFTPRLRTVTAAVDPTLRVYDAVSLDRVNKAELEFIDFWFRLLLVVSVVALTLSLAGIYAVMSFTVARRTREIGIRVALGASQRRIVLAIFRRPLTQVALGVLTGAGLIGTLIFGVTKANGGTVTPLGVATLAGYALVMLGVCLLACIVPTRRALRIEPTEALRSDG